MKLKYKPFTFKGEPIDAYSLDVTLLIQDDPVNPIAGAFFDYDDACFNVGFAKECGVDLQVIHTQIPVFPNSQPVLYNLIKSQKNV